LPVLVAMMAVTAMPAWASDVAREQRMAEQIEDAILVGDPIRLQAGDSEFLAIRTEAEGERKGSVLILHGTGVHPDWPDVVYPLRTELPALGWETLSIQLPVAAGDAPHSAYLQLFPEARERIDAALGFLLEQDARPIFVVGHSLGSAMAADYLAAGGGHSGEVAGFVAVGMSANVQGAQTGVAADLTRIAMPVLDLYGSEDLATVRDTAADRARIAGDAGNTHYQQIKVEGANHFFNGRDSVLVETVAGWLQQGGGQ
jgi:pimeloyl-ACP methyl ester carboxylesterase